MNRVIIVSSPGRCVLENRKKKVSARKDENDSLDAKEANLYCKNSKITQKLAFYIIKLAILRPDSFSLLDLILGHFRCKIR